MNGKELYEKLGASSKNVYERNLNLDGPIFDYAKGYIDFLNKSKTERLSTQYAIAAAEKHGFVPYHSVSTLKQGDKVYFVNREKAIILAIIGKDLNDGINLVGAHIDSPRLDLKQNPLFEDTKLGYLKTHYYGGIKKYQWTAIPLAIYGIIYTKNGTKVEIAIGDKPDDPVFTVTDLLPHLSDSQANKKVKEAIAGEKLNVLCGSIPFDAETKDAVKLNLLKLLNEQYGIVEEDFICGELEIVPAFNAKDVGFDRSLVGGYGQDDRVCAYTALTAILNAEPSDKTAMCYLVDKEEIGSMGNTGAQSRFFEHVVYDICKMTGADRLISVRKSACLSADVGAALDPIYPEVSEKRNSAYLNRGVLLTKYTGARGKSGANDAHAEFVHGVRKVLDEAGIVWQTGELGQVDEGGGGTIAQFMANLNMDVLDAGVPLLSMHSPFEIASKADIYMTYLCYKAFMEKY